MMTWTRSFTIDTTAIPPLPHKGLRTIVLRCWCAKLTVVDTIKTSIKLDIASSPSCILLNGVGICGSIQISDLGNFSRFH